MKQSAGFLVLFSGLSACYPSAILLDGATEGLSDGNSIGGDSSRGGATTRGTAATAGHSTGGSTAVGTLLGTVTVGVTYPACTAPYANVRSITNQNELITAIAGDWYLCGNQSAFCANDERGLRVNEDGTWTTLYIDVDGALIEAASSATSNYGTWVSSFESTSQIHITNIGFRFAPGGGYATFAQFSEDGTRMAFTNTACTATYVKSTALDSTGVDHQTVNGIPVELNPTTATINSSTLAQCDPNKSNLDSTTLDTLQNSLTGLWMLCPTSGEACSTGEVGIEFDAEGRWYNLYKENQGFVYRGLGSKRRGDYQVVDNGSVPEYYTIFSQTYGDPLWNYTTEVNAALSPQLSSARFAPGCNGYYQKL